jgi:hypothetical protein
MSDQTKLTLEEIAALHDQRIGAPGVRCSRQNEEAYEPTRNGAVHFPFILSSRFRLRSDGNRSGHSPHSYDDESGMSFSIPQEERLLKPVVLSIGRIKARRRSEVVLTGGNGLAGGDTIQHILRAMPDSRIAHFNPYRVRRLDDIVCIYQRESVPVDELPVGSPGQDATGNPGSTAGPTGDRDRAPEPKGTPPEFEYRSNADLQFDGELEARRDPCFDHVRLQCECELGPNFAGNVPQALYFELLVFVQG